MPHGRPSDYKEEYCDQLIEHMSQGYSFESFAATIDAHRDTLYEWNKVYPDFSDAKKRASMKSLFQWEKVGMAGTLGKIKNFSTGTWIFNMKNRFNWSDRHEVTTNERKKEEYKPLDSMKVS